MSSDCPYNPYTLGHFVFNVYFLLSAAKNCCPFVFSPILGSRQGYPYDILIDITGSESTSLLNRRKPYSPACRTETVSPSASVILSTSDWVSAHLIHVIGQSLKSLTHIVVSKLVFSEQRTNPSLAHLLAESSRTAYEKESPPRRPHTRNPPKSLITTCPIPLLFLHPCSIFLLFFLPFLLGQSLLTKNSFRADHLYLFALTLAEQSQYRYTPGHFRKNTFTGCVGGHAFYSYATTMSVKGSTSQSALTYVKWVKGNSFPGWIKETYLA